MQPSYQSSERGQAILLIVLSMVVLLGLTALAVDGSMVYADRRYAQSIADSASLAGASIAARQLEAAGISHRSWTANPPVCTGKVAAAANAGREAAIRRADSNNVKLDADISDNSGVSATCGVQDIFATTSSGSKVKIFSDLFMDVTALVTRNTETAFAHFVYQGPLVNTTTAIARIRPRQPLAYGYAIVALNPAACQGNTNGIQFRGSSVVGVTGGGVWSNGCMDVDGNPDVSVTDGQVVYFEAAKHDTVPQKVVMQPSGAPALLKNATDKIPPATYTVAAPSCTAANEMTANEFVSYYDVHKKAIPEGLWCISGDISVTKNSAHIEAYGVTLVVTGDIKLTGGTVILTSPPVNYVGQALPGILIYAPKSNTNEWKINGNNNFFLKGTILAPGASIEVEGTSLQNAFQSQIIAWNVNIGGNADTAVTYDDRDQATKPTMMDMYR